MTKCVIFHGYIFLFKNRSHIMEYFTRQKVAFYHFYSLVLLLLVPCATGKRLSVVLATGSSVTGLVGSALLSLFIFMVSVFTHPSCWFPDPVQFKKPHRLQGILLQRGTWAKKFAHILITGSTACGKSHDKHQNNRL